MWHCIGSDLAATAVERARTAASKLRLCGSLEYRVSDLETSDLGETGLDLEFSHHAVHHLRNLELVLDNVHKALRPRGISHLNEFVGTDRQVQEMNRLAGERAGDTPAHV